MINVGTKGTHDSDENDRSAVGDRSSDDRVTIVDRLDAVYRVRTVQKTGARRRTEFPNSNPPPYTQKIIGSP